LDNFNKGYMVNDLGNEYLNLYEVNIETGSCENLTNIQNDVEEIQVSNDKKKILFSVNKDGFSKLYVYDLILNEKIPLKLNLNGVVQSVLWGKKQEINFIYSSFDEPYKIIRYNITEIKQEVLLENSLNSYPVESDFNTFK